MVAAYASLSRKFALSMNGDQFLAFGILAATFVLFVWAKWRYDVVAVLALLAVVLTGLVSPSEAFLGFAHPAVLTVAAVLIISRALQNAGLVDFVVRVIRPLRGRENLQLAAQTFVIVALSGFMNNVGALALMLPVALRNAYRDKYPPAKSLMPLAFGSLLGGLTTLIGTPPNIIVSAYRTEQAGQPFGMFDFAPVGAAIAVAGLLYLVLVGWRLIPKGQRSSTTDQPFKIEDYTTEASVPEDSKAAGLTVFELEELAHDEVTILGVIRDQTRRLVPGGYQRIQEGDILILRGDADALKSIMDDAGLKMLSDEHVDRETLKSEEVDVVEAIVSPGSRMIGRTPLSMRLRTIHSINLLAIAREGHRVDDRLAEVRFQSGDVLLLQGPAETMSETLANLQLLPLAERDVSIGRQRRLILSAGIFAAAIVMITTGMLQAHVAFIAAAAGMVVTNVVKPDEAYGAIDWPVIVLLGAMFPVGAALESTGGTIVIADTVLRVTEGLGTVWVLLIVLVVTMFVSDVINNNATAVLMAPIAATVATRLGVNVDPFLMAVAIGASCAFLTPIGHQSNAIVMEPGGYRFGDYWRVGLPLEAIIVAVAIPMILLVWPF